jgi:hypothetical protein
MYLYENIFNILWEYEEIFLMNLIIIKKINYKTLWLTFLLCFQILNHLKWIKTNIIMNKKCPYL